MNLFFTYSEIITTALFCACALGIVWCKEFRFLRMQLRLLFTISIIAVLWTVLTDPYIHIHGIWIYDQEHITLARHRLLYVPIFEYIYIFLVAFTIGSGFLAIYHRTSRNK